MTIDSIEDNPIRTLPAGDYIIGDLCYFLQDAVYQQLVVRGNEGSRVVTCTIDGQPIEMYASFYSTMYGDGTYHDHMHKEYPVDAGILGCVRIDNLPPIVAKKMLADATDSAHVCHFDIDFTVDYHDGVINFGERVVIDTDLMDQEDQDDDDGFIDYEDDADEDNWEDFDDWDTR